jgi:DNA repair protein RadC
LAEPQLRRDLIRAGQLMKIEVLDYVIMGNQARSSLREMSVFYS